MAVTFSKTPHPGENVAFSNKPSVLDKNIKVHDLRIDKISLTLDIPEEDRGIIQAKMIDAGKNEGFSICYPKNSKYSINREFTEYHSGKKILCQGVPFSKKVAFTRFEFNPSKVGPQGIATFFESDLPIFLGTVYGSLREFYTRAKVTRLDIALDVTGAGLNSFFMRVDSDNKYMAFFGNEGGLETLYGKLNKKKPHSIIMYDKGLQLKEDGRSLMFPDTNHTRFEVRYTQTRAFNKLDSIPNQLQKLHVDWIDLDPPSPEKKHHWRWFIDSCHFRGIEASLALIADPQIKDRYAYRLQKACIPLFDAKDLWKTWPDVVKNSGLFPPSLY